MTVGHSIRSRIAHVPLPMDQISRFCDRWHVTELALFGSVLRDDFGPESDINVLVTFEPDARHGLLDVTRMEDELRAIFHRDVMVLTRKGLEMSRNAIRRQGVLDSAEVVYVRP